MLPIIFFALLPQVLALTKIDSLPILVNFKPLDKGLTLVDRDRARIRGLFRKHEKRAKTKNVVLKNTGTEYAIKVGFGSPPTYYNLWVDIRSAYTWVGTDKGYIKTKTSVRQGGQELFADLALGEISGAHYKDVVTLSPSLKVTNMSFGVTSSSIFQGLGIDGFFGLGPTALGEAADELPTIMNTLVAQNKIRRNMFGLLFAPSTSQGAVNGKLSFGEFDQRKLTSKLTWVKTTRKIPNEPWSFEQTIKYGKRVIQPSLPGIVDSGTTLIFISAKAFEEYSQSIPGSKIDKSTGLLEIPKGSISEMKSLYFVINGVPHELTPKAQLLPRELRIKAGTKEGAHYSVIASLDKTEPSIGFISGYTFLQRFYTAYDGSDSRIGFATTTSTYNQVN